MRTVWGWALIAILFSGFMITSGCKVTLDDNKSSEDDGDSSKKKKKKKKKKGDDEDDEPTSKTKGTKNEGSFVFKFEEANSATYKPYEALFTHGRLKSLVQAMSIIGLPRDVPIATGECGQPNAFYSPKKHAVIMCYELAHLFYEKFISKGSSDQEASDATLNALTFVLLHEMGHAVIGELDLGVTGGEEDAVDDLASLLLVDAKQPGWAVDGARSMAILGEGGQMPFHDEHSLGEQRYYNIICIVFGSDPQKYLGLVEQGILPEKRAVRCQTEYKRKDKAWTTMIGPHLKK